MLILNNWVVLYLNTGLPFAIFVKSFLIWKTLAQRTEKCNESFQKCNYLYSYMCIGKEKKDGTLSSTRLEHTRNP